MTSAVPYPLPMPPGCTCFPVPPDDFNQAIEKAFLTAILLTASPERAEAAILTATRIMDPGVAPADALLRAAVPAALEMECALAAEDRERASSMVPLELRPLLHLETGKRLCFVLRVLVGLSRQACSGLLRLAVPQIDEYTCAAMLELPAMQRTAAGL